MWPEGTIFKADGNHVLPATLERPAHGATEQPKATARSFVSKMIWSLPPLATDASPVEYMQWLYYALMQFGKTWATLLCMYTLHGAKGVVPAVLLENRNCVESQRKFVLDMRRLVQNVRNCARWVLSLDKEKRWLSRSAACGGGGAAPISRHCFAHVQEATFLENLDLRMRAKTLKLEDLTSQGLTEDEARLHVGTLKVETRDLGDGRYERRLEGGNNQGVVMLCNSPNVEQLLGVGHTKKSEGLVSLLIGQSLVQRGACRGVD